MELVNRVVVSPMAQYCAVDGMPDDWHLVHYGHRALGGAGLVYTEMTCVSPEGRITPGCTGLWNEGAARRVAAHRRLRARYTRRRRSACSSGTPAARAPRSWAGSSRTIRCRAATGRSWRPRRCRIWRASARRRSQMTRADMDKVREDFVRATRFGAAGRLRHARAAHGARLPARLVPVAAHQSAQGRVRRQHREPPALPAGGADARCAREWPRGQAACPCASRRPTGPTAACQRSRPAAPSCARFKAAGVDLIDVSTGQTVPWQKPVYGRMWQTPFADQMRNDIGIATMAVGNIYEPDHVNSIIAAGRADLVRRRAPASGQPGVDAGCGGAPGLSARSGGRISTCPARASSSAICSARRRPAVRHDVSAAAHHFRGRHAVVTGASRGIGAAIAAALAARRRARLAPRRATKRSLARVSQRSSAASAHAAASRQTSPTADSVEAHSPPRASRFGPVHILVNNAGQAASAKFTDTDEALWNRIMAVNLTGTYPVHARRPCPTCWSAGFGRIVNIASIAGLRGAAYISAYAPPSTPSSASPARWRSNTPREHHRECRVPGLHRHGHRQAGHRQHPNKTGRSESEALAALVATNPQRRLIKPRGSRQHGAVAVPPGLGERHRTEHRARRRRSYLSGVRVMPKDKARLKLVEPRVDAETRVHDDHHVSRAAVAADARVHEPHREPSCARTCRRTSRPRCRASTSWRSSSARRQGLKMSELSQRMMVTGGNVTGITDGLEKEGLVVREVDAADRRVFRVKLTAEGQRQFRRMAAEHEQWVIELFDAHEHQAEEAARRAAGRAQAPHQPRAERMSGALSA